MGLLERLVQTVEDKRWWQSGEPVAVAVSTGVDSMALVTLLQALPTPIRPKIVVAHVNHKLRAQSDAEETFLRQYCAKHALQLEVATWPINEHPNHGVEGAARDFRYSFFASVMKATQARVLVTAHHADDQVETILMKLIRGGEIQQLLGMQLERPFADGVLVRPFLNEPKAVLKKAMVQAGVKWFEDATNAETTTLRNELRNAVIPEFEQLNPQFKARLLAYQTQLSQVLQLADSAATVSYERVMTAGERGRMAGWQKLDGSHQLAVLRRLLTRQALAVNEAQLLEIQGLLNNRARPQGSIALADGWRFTKSYDYFYLSNGLEVDKKPLSAVNYVVVSNQWTPLGHSRALRVVKGPSTIMESSDTMLVSLTSSDFPLVVRSARPSDTIALQSGGHKQVRRIWIDQRMPNDVRDQSQVVTTATGEVLWLLGVQRSARPMDVKQQAYQLQLKRDKGETDE